MSPEVIDALVAAGVTAEQLAAAIKADLASEADRIAARRAKAAAKKRRQRGSVPSCPGDIEGQKGTDGDTPSLSPSPQTPQPHTHPRGDIPRAREGAVSQVDLARGFVAFWAAYPKRKAKDAAAKAFAKAMARIQDPDPLAVILAGIERALPGWDDPQFIPHPATWLNAGSWDDEAPQPRRAEARNVRPDRHSAQHDHLSAVARAMAAACDRPEGEPVRDRTSPGPESGGRFLPAAA